MIRKKWLIGILLCVVVMGLCLSPMVIRWRFEQRLSSVFEGQSTFDGVYLTGRSKLHIADSEYDMFAVMKDNSEDGSFQEVLLVDKGRVWFTYVEYQQIDPKWCLASIDLYCFLIEMFDFYQKGNAKSVAILRFLE